jgi:hypothetical protein
MASTYSQYKIELVGTGEQAGTWGTTTNNNFGSATPGTYQGFEQAIGGRADVTMSGTTTLSLTNSNAAQDARALYLNLSGTLSGAADLVVPALQKSYLVKNGTTGGFAVTIKVTGQTGVSIPNGKTVWVYNNGTDVVTAVDFIPEIATTTVDTTNIEVTNIKAKDGTSAGSIADSTGVVTLASSVLTTTDINGGTIDGAVIGGASAAAGSFTTLNTSGAVVFNDAGADVDFRVEGDTDANLLFVDASTDRVGIGTSSPAQTLHVKTSTSATPITFGVLSNATGLPALSFNGAYASTTMAGIYASGGTSTGLYYMIPTGNSHFFGIADVTKMTIDSSGNVGIGTTSPAKLLNVGSASGEIRLGAGAGLEITHDNAGDTVGEIKQLYAASSALAQFKITSGFTTFHTGTSGTERMRITSDGNVGINTSSPTYKLQVTGTNGSEVKVTRGTNDFIISLAADAGNPVYIGTVANSPLLVQTNGTERMRIQANGGLSFANTASPGPFNTVLGDRNNHFTGQRSNTVPSGTTSTMLTINFGLNGAAIVRVVDAGSVPGSDYFMNVYEYFVTCYAGVVTATLKQSQAGGGAGSFITTSTGSAEFNVIQTANASIATVHDTAVDVLTASSGNGAHDTTTITMAANN